MIGQIYKIYSNSYYVKNETGSFVCKIREILKKQKTSVAAGDYVEFDGDIISKILPRKSYIKRPAAANIDQIIVVSALKNPDLDFHQLNRYLSLAKYYKIPAVLCFNKEDLGLDNKIQNDIISIYDSMGYKILFTSALEKIGTEDFKKVLKGKLSALCGSSGVGKSSLINALNPNIHLRTQSVSDKLGRGTHTTRHCEIIPIGRNTDVIDTPGFSSLKFDFILPKDVDMLFEDISKYSSGCKYSDCLHINESDCEVLKNLDNIPHSRYESYLELVNEAFEYKEQVKYNGQKTESFLKKNNNKIVAKISEKKRRASRNTEKQLLYKDLNKNEYE